MGVSQEEMVGFFRATEDHKRRENATYARINERNEEPLFSPFIHACATELHLPKTGAFFMFQPIFAKTGTVFMSIVHNLKK